MNFSKNLRNLENYNYIFAALLIAGLAGTALWYGYSWYIRSHEEAAQLAFSEGLEEYFKKLNNIDSTRTWEDLERAFDRAANLHQKSKLYPYFLALKADVLVQQGKLDQAGQIMKVSLNGMQAAGPSQPIFYLYEVKQALFKLDSENPKIQEEGYQELLKLSQKKDSSVYNMVMYYLGLYAQSQGKNDEAKKYFDEIISSDKESNWALMAQERLGW